MFLNFGKSESMCMVLREKKLLYKCRAFFCVWVSSILRQRHVHTSWFCSIQYEGISKQKPPSMLRFGNILGTLAKNNQQTRNYNNYSCFAPESKNYLGDRLLRKYRYTETSADFDSLRKIMRKSPEPWHSHQLFWGTFFVLFLLWEANVDHGKK